MRIKQGHPIPILRSSGFSKCFYIIDGLREKAFRPEYVILTEFNQHGKLLYFELCKEKFEELEMYEMIKEVKFDYDKKDSRQFVFHWYREYIFKLRPEFNPPFC